MTAVHDVDPATRVAAPGRIAASGNKIAKESVDALGRFGGLCSVLVDSAGLAVKSMVQRRFPWWELLTQARFLVSVSLLPTVLISIPFGLVLVLEIGGLTGQLGAQSLVGAVVSVGTVREIAPIITGIVLAGEGGSAICADLGSRNIRGEIAALRVMAVDPLERLVAPRMVAMTVVGVLLNGVVSFVGIVTGYLAQVLILHGSAGGFLNAFSAFAQSADLWESFLKAAVFGLVAAAVASYEGLTCEHGPTGVGSAVNKSVVVSGVSLFILNLVITQIFLVTVPPVLL